jgi:hypothetical protein
LSATVRMWAANSVVEMKNSFVNCMNGRRYIMDSVDCILLYWYTGVLSLLLSLGYY